MNHIFGPENHCIYSQLQPKKPSIVETTRTTSGVASSKDVKFHFMQKRVMCNNVFIPGPSKGCQMDGSWGATKQHLRVQQNVLESAGRHGRFTEHGMGQNVEISCVSLGQISRPLEIS